MTDEPLDPTVRDALREPIESWAAGGDFDSAWAKARRGPTGGSRWVAPLALAAAAVLVLGIPARQAWEAHQDAETHAGGALATRAPSSERAKDWVEPVKLRYPVPSPTVDAAPHLRVALTSLVQGSGVWSEPWKRAVENTPETLRPELYDRLSQAAIQVRDVDRVRDAGEKGTAVGRFLAAEVHIVDLETDSALPLLEAVRTDPVVGRDATRYLELVSRGGAGEGLAEVSALFLLGDERNACHHVLEIWPDADERQRALAGELAPGLVRCAPGEGKVP